MPSRVRINVFKMEPEAPEKAFGRWKDRARFVGDIGQEGGISTRLYAPSPEGMGRLLALNMRKSICESVEIFSDARNAMPGKPAATLSALERCEVEPILKALAGALGAWNVDDRTDQGS